MPLSPVDRPSLGLTLLAESLKQSGLRTHVLYPNLTFVKRVGKTAYDRLALNQFANKTLVGEWIFSRLVCPVADMDTYLQHLRNRFSNTGGGFRVDDDIEALSTMLPELTAAATELVESLTDTVAQYRPRVVGFSSCYNQHLASLAAANRIKMLFPDIFTVLGGVNCNGVMGLETFRCFPFLDAVIAGPGEVALPLLVKQVLDGRRDLTLSGVHLRAADGSIADHLIEGYAPEPPLDALPFPDYTDFFTAANELSIIPHTVPIEGSRGCWWGQKHHCVFCAENAESMRYRGKSTQRFLEELRWLMAHYPDCSIAWTDEILDLRLLSEAVPQMAETPMQAGGFVSLKANLRKEQVAALATAGFNRLQPGIESLDDDILKPMRKGVLAIRNVQLLKWCKEHGISVSWGLLFGFPFDTAEPYQRMAELLPLLTHLPPPGLARVVLQRFSPLTRDAEEFGLRNLRPNDSYRFIYPFEPGQIERLAFRFIADWKDEQEANTWWQPMMKAAAAWQKAAGKAYLFHDGDGQRLWICDTRPTATRFLHQLTGAARSTYLALDSARPLHAITEALPESHDHEDTDTIVENLMANKLIIKDKNLYLALSHRLNLHALPPPEIMARYLAAKSSLAKTPPEEIYFS